jgi:hypothetical protein
VFELKIVLREQQCPAGLAWGQKLFRAPILQILQIAANDELMFRAKEIVSPFLKRRDNSQKFAVRVVVMKFRVGEFLRSKRAGMKFPVFPVLAEYSSKRIVTRVRFHYKWFVEVRVL